MRRYNAMPRRRHVLRRLLFVILALLVVLVVGAFAVQRWYYMQLRAVDTSMQKHYVTIASGSSAATIAKQLSDARLIRSAQAFSWYISVHNDRDKLQAGTYSFMTSQTTSQIADMIATGRIASDLITILPGKRIDQIRQAFITAGFQPAVVDTALNASQYRADYPALADNPSGASLEGFLYPDSFQKTATTDPKLIIEESLTEMQQHLTTDIRASFAREGLTVYQGVTLASIVEQEVSI
ncbi:MAG: endolytic transglycosylase MltG, partial [Candidatus Micrarchaeaceae archaeon]